MTFVKRVVSSDRCVFLTDNFNVNIIFNYVRNRGRDNVTMVNGFFFTTNFLCFPTGFHVKNVPTRAGR